MKPIKITSGLFIKFIKCIRMTRKGKSSQMNITMRREMIPVKKEHINVDLTEKKTKSAFSIDIGMTTS